MLSLSADQEAEIEMYKSFETILKFIRETNCFLFPFIKQRKYMLSYICLSFIANVYFTCDRKKNSKHHSQT